jgi:hypothetical protein
MLRPCHSACRPLPLGKDFGPSIARVVPPLRRRVRTGSRSRPFFHKSKVNQGVTGRRATDTADRDGLLRAPQLRPAAGISGDQDLISWLGFEQESEAGALMPGIVPRFSHPSREKAPLPAAMRQARSDVARRSHSRRVDRPSGVCQRFLQRMPSSPTTTSFHQSSTGRDLAARFLNKLDGNRRPGQFLSWR